MNWIMLPETCRRAAKRFCGIGARLALALVAGAGPVSIPIAAAVSLGWSQGGPPSTIYIDGNVSCGRSSTLPVRPVARDNAGNFIVTGCVTDAGAANDFLTVKYDGGTGAELWQAYADGAAHSNDQAYAVVVDGSDNVVVTGASQNAGGSVDFLTIKYNGGTGTEMWRAVGDGAAHKQDTAIAVAVDGSGNVFVTGISVNAAGHDDFLTIKYSGSTGAELWRAVGDGAAQGDDEARAMVVDAGGNVIVSGSGETSPGYFDVLTIKYNGATGAEMWRAVGDGAALGYDHTGIVAVTLDGNGNVVAAGTAYSGSAGPDFLTVKYDGVTGANLWRAVGDGAAHLGDTAAGVAVDGNHNIVVAGVSGNLQGNFDFLTIKYNGASGTEMWRAVGDGAAHGIDNPVGVALDGGGNVFVTGTSANGSGGQDYLTIKYNGTTGGEQWRAVADGATHSGDFPQGLAVDQNGDVAVAGSSVNAGGNFDFMIVKYGNASPAELWRRVSATIRYAPSAIGRSPQRTMALDGSGHLVVTGSAYGTDGSQDFLTIKFDAATGAQLWQANTDGAAHRNDFASAMALDGSGNVVVTGQSYLANGTYDYLTVKYDGANGAELWRTTFDGTGHSYDIPIAVAVDGVGNVVVTGTTVNAGGHYDYLTIKYNGLTGAEIWRAVGDGAAHLNDYASELALDGNGNVYVTGASYTAGAGSDALTIKYDGVTGAEVWRAVADGPAHKDDSSVSLALDGSGNVLVAAYTATANLTYDYMMLKYDGTSGAEMWRSFSDGAAHGYDLVLAMALDHGGNPLVTGFSQNLAGNNDYLTIKYDGSTGAELWRAVGDGAANAEDEVHAIAADGSGNAIVTGVSTNASGDTDMLTISYDGVTGAELWRHVYAGSGNDADGGYAVLAAPGAVFVGGNSIEAGEPSRMRVIRLLPPLPSVPLTVTKGGSGVGTVSSVPPGIDCGGDCSEAYPQTTPVTLTATPAAGSVFMGWLGACIGTADCHVTINAATAVSATFAPDSVTPRADIDGNNHYDALTDGLLMLRYLFGLTGTALTNGAVGDGPARATPADILQYLDNIRPLLDVDGNGQADALTDGLLLLRYLFGLRGPALVVGAVGAGATRTTPAEIEPYIQSILPP